MAIIGFLPPDGVFIPCHSWGHMDTAIRICKDLNQKFTNGVEAEEYLLQLGYVVFTSRDCYMYHYKTTIPEEETEEETTEYIYLTEAQINFIQTQEERLAWNDYDQAFAVHRLVENDAFIFNKYGRIR